MVSYYCYHVNTYNCRHPNALWKSVRLNAAGVCGAADWDVVDEDVPLGEEDLQIMAAGATGCGCGC